MRSFYVHRPVKLQEQLFNRKRQAAESCQNRCAIRRRTKLFECLPYLQKLHKRAVRDDRSGPSTVPIPGEKTGPFHSPASLILARLIRSAQPRDDDSEPVLLVGQNVEGSILLLIFAMRRLHRDSWKQAARLFGFENALDADGHGRGTMRNLVFLRASDYLRKRMLENAEELISHFHFAPKKLCRPCTHSK